MVTILQQEPSPWEKFFGGLTQGYMQGRQQKQMGEQQRQQSLGVARMLYPGRSDDELLSIVGTATPEQMIDIAKMRSSQTQDMITPRGASLISRVQKGEKIPENEMTGLSDKEMRTILRAQEVAGIQPSEEQKMFVKTNIEKGEKASEASESEDTVIRLLSELEDLTLSGAADDYMSNLVTEYGIKPLYFLQNPGSQAYMTAFKGQFNDFRTTFGSRPAQYEAQIFEKGLPGIMSPRDAKLAGIYQLQATKMGKKVEAEARTKAIEELGYKVQPAEINKRAKEIADQRKDEIYDDYRMKFHALLTKNMPLGEGEAFYYDMKNHRIIKGPADKEDEVKSKGLRMMK